ncbi:MAG: tagaturonate epimerase family protein [Kiritimatiellae bacterium]|nr:tagaturonate epimerase family protein [Kiritimatiellia bacterium]
MIEIGRYSMGIGDRFGQQGVAQLRAFLSARQRGIEVTPVWNKSFREHSLVGTSPCDVRREADAAVRELGWDGPYFVDADHIGMKNVAPFIEPSDFFTIDVAEHIGGHVEQAEIDDFVGRHVGLTRRIRLPGTDEIIELSVDELKRIAAKYLAAIHEAGRIFRHIASCKGAGGFVVEVSMDETDQPQQPQDLLVILGALADEKIPLRTIAPKFSGRFNKGVDYVGDIRQFVREFRCDLAVVRYAVDAFNLPPTLKLSIHSGSDKFSLYPAIRECLRSMGAGVHLKTAGTTWLEEVAGLALAGGDGLSLVREIYRQAYARMEELCAPYLTVVDIDRKALPTPSVVAGWSGEEFAAALRHEASCVGFNPHFRQLIHVAYKIAAELGDRFLGTLRSAAAIVGPGVTRNILEKHLLPLFDPEFSGAG